MANENSFTAAAAALVEEMRRNIEEESYLATVAGPETIEFFSLNNTATEEWKLTLDSYIKFQLRRQAHPTAGALPFKKNLMKILIEQNISKEAEGPGLLDSIHESSLQYLRQAMWSREEYVTIHEEMRNQVIDNAKILLEEMKCSYLASRESGEGKKDWSN
jgi:hypothetical protein